MTSKYAKGIVKSTWTPLNHEDSNLKIFEERRSLVNKWFDMWNTNQRKVILEDLLTSCNGNQIEYAKIILSTKAIQKHVDFTRILPRVICLYIFSFLDPRSLCRTAQVCWYWKYLAESNELWAPKCARLGWYFTGPINTMESGLWKKHFIDNILYLQITRPAKDLTALEIAKQIEKDEALRKAKKLKEKQLHAQKIASIPWRGPDPRPIDIVRNNYIDNDIENGARLKLIYQKPNQKSRRFSHSEGHLSAKEKLRTAVPIIQVDQNNISLTTRSKTEVEEIRSHTPVTPVTPVENVQRPGPINGHSKTNNMKPLEKFQTERPSTNNTEDLTDIPSGRPWILPNDQEDI